MNKVIRDGKVAVLYSPQYGAGWYTWTNKEELLYDPVIVEMVLSEASTSEIQKYCEETYGELDFYYGGADRLTVEWLPVGTKFIIHEYDGYESVWTEDNMYWKVA